MAKTSIQWTAGDDGSLGETWNPVVGCTRVSSGCDHCYAFALHDKRHVAWKRGRWDKAPAQYHKPFSRVQLLPQRLSDPLRWRTPRRVFVNSMSDLWHQDVPDEFIERVFGVMASAPQHTFQVLTKRPGRMRDWVRSHTHEGCAAANHAAGDWSGMPQRAFRDAIERVGAGWPWPLPNVWLGTSVEHQAAADERIPCLIETPAAVRFLSCEPLLGPLQLNAASEYATVDMMDGGLDWVIIGGESGPHARPMDLSWVRSLIEQCRMAGVAVFVKQLGSVWAKQYGAHDHHGGDMSEWPEDLRVREYPA